jgi:hypothetical protein
MGRNSSTDLVSCYQCAGIEFCYGAKNPELSRDEARSKAGSCISLHKGFTTESVIVTGYGRCLSRDNAEKLVANSLARWCGYKTIEPINELPLGIQNRLTKTKKVHKEMLVIS